MPKTKLDADFPRGGESHSWASEKTPKKKEQELFKTDLPSDSKKKRKQKRQSTDEVADVGLSKKRRLQSGKDDSDAHTDMMQIECLAKQIVARDMLILGSVKEIHDYELVLSLPNDLRGVVPISHVASTYTSQLHKFSENPDEAMSSGEMPSSLSDLFTVGQVMPCRVMDEECNKWKVAVTINPSDVNQGVLAKALKNGMLLYGAVSSVEDHGYVIDLGVKGVRAFLSTQDAESFVSSSKNGEPLAVGQHLPCVLKNVDMAKNKRTVGLITDTKLVKKAELKESMEVAFHSLVPGMKVHGTVTECHANGLVMQFLSFTGRIHRSHLPCDTTPYEQQQKIQATILYIEPTTKVIYLTALPHLTRFSEQTYFTGVSSGDILEECRVLSLDKRRGVYFDIGENIKGYSTIGNLHDTKVSTDLLVKQFKKGSIHRCRVMDFNYLENKVLLTLKESILKQQYLSYKDFYPGQKLKTRVLSVQERGVVVKVSSRIRGFIPSIHLAEVPLKHPEKKYQKDAIVKCRVLRVDPDISKLILTAKKSLVQSKMDVIASYDTLKPNMLVQGFIACVKDNGVMVVFYNNVKGWVPLKELSDEVLPYPKKVFYTGQVVQCRVMACNSDLAKLTLSFRVDHRPSFGSKRVDLPPDYAVGKFTNCTVVGKIDGGLNVQLTPSSLSAFIPKMHLSDYSDLCQILWELHQEGDVIKDAMYVHSRTTITLTCKQSFLQASKNGQLVTEFDQLKPGMLIPCWMRNRMDYGYFLELSSQLIGLAPNKFVCDHRLTDYSGLYKAGQSLIAKVTEVDSEKRRFLLSLRMSDCYHDNVDDSTDIVRNYLKQSRQVTEMFSKRKGKLAKLASIKVGLVIRATVTEVTNHGVLCSVSDGLKGFATSDHMPGVQCKVGDSVECIVLFVDLQGACLELSLNRDLIKAVKHLHDNKFTQVKEGQVMKCEVHLIKDDIVLVSLRGHAMGRLAYLPAKKHLNDLQEKRQFIIGQVNSIVIKSCDESHVIGVLQVHDNKHIGHDEKKTVLKKHELKLGQVVSAVIKSVLDFQLNITIDGVAGRVHISEVQDEPEEKSCPLSDFEQGQEVKVKILGFREVKSHRYLPVTHPNFAKALPECTLRPSKLRTSGYHDSELPNAKTYRSGDTVQGYVHSYSNHYLWLLVNPSVKAKVSILHLSKDKKVCLNPLKTFKVGSFYHATVAGVINDEKLEASLIGSVSPVASGNVVRGFITKVSPSVGVTVQLPGGCSGRVALTDIKDKFVDCPTKGLKENHIVKCYVVSLESYLCTLSLRQSRTEEHGHIVDREINSIHEVNQESVVKGYVLSCHEKGVFVSIGRCVTGHVCFTRLSDYFIKDLEKVFFPGKVVTAKVLSIDSSKEHLELSLLERDTGVSESIPEDQKVNRRHDIKKAKPSKRKAESKQDSSNSEGSQQRAVAVKEAITKEEGDSGVEMTKESEDEDEGKHPTDTAPPLQLSAVFDWNASLNTLTETPGGDQSSSEESDGDDNSVPAKKSKLELKRDEKEEEKILYKTERRNLSSDLDPVTADDYDRLVMQSPDSSLVWMRYMTFYLENAEMDKSRTIAERALKTISFREEGEKFNIWIAYMNLENMYGSPETLKAVFDRAVQQMEPLKVYQQLVNIYVESDKCEQAEQLYNTMLRKFRQHRDVWIQYGRFLFQQLRADAGRTLMQRSLKSLDWKQHLDVITKFAQLEFKYGEVERGKTMFDNVLSNYTKRIDIWSVYIDLVVKAGEIHTARQLFEKVTNVGLNEKKMKVIFKKYMDFEEKHGDEETTNIVRQKAIEYVESRIK